MDFLYTIDPNAEEPIMLIDRHIGTDDEDGEGIMGDKFCRELMFLDTLNKSRINIWINSPGGSVIDGQQIYNTILKTKTKVDTHNVGMAASIAFPIWLAGRNRYMMDNSTAMAHPVSGGDHKSREAMANAVTTMISSRSFIPSDKVTEMMNRTTWLKASDCGPGGYNLCEVEMSAGFNKPRKSPEADGLKASWADYRSVVNKLIENKKPHIMSKVTNKLKLVEGANEDLQLAAIESIENRAITAENKLTTQETENKAKIDALNSQLAAEKTAKEEAEKKVKEIEDKAKADAEVTNKARATDYVKNQVDTGRIVNDPDIIKDWTERLTADFEKNKALVEKLPINKKAPSIVNKLDGEKREIPEGSNPPSIDLNNTTSFVARMNAKTYNKAKERFK